MTTNHPREPTPEQVHERARDILDALHPHELAIIHADRDNAIAAAVAEERARGEATLAAERQEAEGALQLQREAIQTYCDEANAAESRARAAEGELAKERAENDRLRLLVCGELTRETERLGLYEEPSPALAASPPVPSQEAEQPSSAVRGAALADDVLAACLETYRRGTNSYVRALELAAVEQAMAAHRLRTMLQQKLSMESVPVAFKVASPSPSPGVIARVRERLARERKEYPETFRDGVAFALRVLGEEEGK